MQASKRSIEGLRKKVCSARQSAAAAAAADMSPRFARGTGRPHVHTSPRPLRRRDFLVISAAFVGDHFAFDRFGFFFCSAAMNFGPAGQCARSAHCWHLGLRAWQIARP
jgi:hypothetical protein